MAGRAALTKIPRITVAERRARLVSRHHLGSSHRAGSVEDVVDDLVALHATDPSAVYLSTFARLREPSVGAVEQALYDDRTIVRMLGMRRTMFVISADLVPVVQRACTDKIAATERKRTAAMIEHAGITKDGERWVARVEAATLAALEARCQATGAELARDVDDLTHKIPMGEGKTWASEIGVTTRILTLLSADGLIVRGRPRGSWISSQYRWVPARAWLGERAGAALDPPAAQVALARRWLHAFGPGTVADLQWWTGWTLGDTRKALADIELVDVDLDGQPGVVLADDTASATKGARGAFLLPALDPTAMGWKGRDWYLGDHRAALFDRSGNIGPTVWWNGRIVGGWGQRPDGELPWRLLEDVGSGAVKAIEAEVERLAGLLGETRFKPRFRTPLEIELGA